MNFHLVDTLLHFSANFVVRGISHLGVWATGLVK